MQRVAIVLPLLFTRLTPVVGVEHFDSGHPVESAHDAADPLPQPIAVPGEAAYLLADVPDPSPLPDESPFSATLAPRTLAVRKARKTSSTRKRKTTKRKATVKTSIKSVRPAKARETTARPAVKQVNTGRKKTTTKWKTVTKKKTTVRAAVKKKTTTTKVKKITTTKKKVTTTKKTTTTIKKRSVKLRTSASHSAFAITPASSSISATRKTTNLAAPRPRTSPKTSLRTTTQTRSIATIPSPTLSSSSAGIVSASNASPALSSPSSKLSSSALSASTSMTSNAISSGSATVSSAFFNSSTTVLPASSLQQSVLISSSSPPLSSPSSTEPFSSTSTVTQSAPSTSANATLSPAGKRKRGLAYNNDKYTTLFGQDADSGSQVSWTYNWWQKPGDGYNTALEYVPMLWSNNTDLTSTWLAFAQAAIDNGTTSLFSFNEPDLCAPGAGSSCMSVSSAVKAWKKYMQPFAGKAKLGLPAVTNGGAPYGLTWLSKFIDACDGCTFDFVNLHWYSNVYAGANYFESYINSARSVANGLPIWVTEYGLTDGYTQTQLNAFMQTTMAWMDAQPDIARYSYFMATTGFPYLINNAGTDLSATGSLYDTYVNSTKQPNLY